MILGMSRRLVSDLFLEISAFFSCYRQFCQNLRLYRKFFLQKWPKERKTERLKINGDTGYGQIFFENELFLAKLRTNMKLYGSY